MTAVNTALVPEKWLEEFSRGLVTRTLAHWAEEARLDGESLKEAVERYEIDYAWHVLGSERLRDATVAALESELGRSMDAAQMACVVEMLRAAAARQPGDALMSFDNDVPEQLARLLGAWFDGQPKPLAEPA